MEKFLILWKNSLFSAILLLMNPSIVQTKIWEKFQNSLGHTTFFHSEADFSYLAILNHFKLGDYYYLPYGPVLSQKSAAKAAYKELESLARTKNLIFIRIEPQNPDFAKYLLTRANCHKSKDLSPARTWVLDLTLDKDQLLANMKQNNRNLYRNYRKKGLSIEISQNPTSDLRHLVRIQKNIAKRNHIIPPDFNFLKKQLEQPFAHLYLAKFEDKVIATGICFDDKTTRYYMQAAADDRFRKLSAGTSLLAQMIFDAKAKKLQKFDFWGIAPENAPSSHPWAGFSNFKKSFGGTPVDYAGTYDLVFQPVKYQIYRIFRKINRAKRRLLH